MLLCKVDYLAIYHSNMDHLEFCGKFYCTMEDLVLLHIVFDNLDVLDSPNILLDTRDYVEQFHNKRDLQECRNKV